MERQGAGSGSAGQAGAGGPDGDAGLTHPSPNHGPRKGDGPVDIAVIHYTAMASAGAAIARLSDPTVEVSAHYVIDIDGEVASLVTEDRRAWHAGRSAWGDVTDVNSRSIGIELANPGDAPFAARQMLALEGVLDGIMARHPVPAERVVGHACIAPGRKQDPGPRFDWRRLALGGRAVWLDPAMETMGCGVGDASAFQGAAARIGFPVPASGVWDAETLAVWQAFAMRFLPMRAGAEPCGGGVAHAGRLAARWPVSQVN